MKKVGVLIAALLAALAALLPASPLDFQDAAIVNFVDARDPLDYEIKPSSEYYPYLGDVQTQPELPSSYAPEWGTDRLVSDEWQMGASIISLDYDASGNLYVMGMSNSGIRDTLKLYKSTDQGYTWQKVWQYGTATDWQVKDFEMRLNHTGTDPDVYFFMIDTFSSKRTLWFGTIAQPAMTVSFTKFDPDTLSYFENPSRLSMDVTDNSTPNIWCTWEREIGTTEFGWQSLNSQDGGTTWNVMLHASTRGARDPYVSYGNDYVYIVAVYTSAGDSNALRMYMSPISTTGSYLWVSDTQLESRAYPCVASTRETYSNNNVDVLYQEENSGNRRIRESFSTDGGQNWTLSQLWTMTGDFQSVRPYVRAGWSGGANNEFCGVATLIGSYDSLVVGYNTTGSTWESRTVPNDYDATGEVTAQGTVISTGRAVVYREWGSSNVWYESYNNTAVEESPAETLSLWNVSSLGGKITVNFTMPSNQNLTIRVFDITGRTVFSKNLGIVDEGNHSMEISTGELTGGRYFVSLVTGEGHYSKSAILF